MSTMTHTPAPDKEKRTFTDETLAGLSWAGGIPILVVMCIASAIFSGVGFLAGVFSGGCAVIFIHAGMYRSLKGVLSGVADGSRKGGVAVVAGFLLRLVVSGVILAALLLQGWAHPLGVAAGASVIFINNLFLALLLATRKTHQELGGM